MAGLVNEKVIKNSHWDMVQDPIFSIITPVYNRRAIVKRALDSVNNQVFRNMEYIIVDDGSTDNIDEVILPYLKSVDFPVIFIVKENGGLTSARNCGIRYARSRYTVFLDSDDELLPNCLQVGNVHWHNLEMQNDAEDYREVLACDQNEYGYRIGQLFQPDFNFLPKAKQKYAKCERTGFNRTSILKSNPFPEAEGLKYTPELLLWRQLDLRYKKYYINDIVKVYYTGTTGSMTNTLHAGKSIQNILTEVYSSLYYLNNCTKFDFSFFETSKLIFHFLVYKKTLASKTDVLQYPWLMIGLTHPAHRIGSFFLQIPAFLGWLVLTKCISV